MSVWNWAKLPGKPFVIQPRELAATLYDRLVQLAAKAGFHPVVRQQAQQINGLIALVAAGIGLALIPASMQVVKLAGVSYVPLADPEAYLLLVGSQSSRKPATGRVATPGNSRRRQGRTRLVISGSNSYTYPLTLTHFVPGAGREGAFLFEVRQAAAP